MNDADKNHSELSRIVKLTREANDQKYEAHSRAMLKKHITTKFKTTMIGALAQFEEEFGGIWGHGLPEEELSSNQIDWLDKWQLVRTEILNNGNNQLRAALAEVEHYTVRYNKNEYQFTVKEKREPENE